MLFDNDDKEKDDFFDSPPPEEQPKKVEKKKNPEDPEYWEEEESEWEHLSPRNSNRFPYWVWGSIAVLFLGLCIACWLRYFSPYIQDAVQYGYVEHIEKRGTLFETYEGVLIPYKELMDTYRVYSRDFIFSVKDDKTATALRRAQLEAKPVVVGYEAYHATLPWRGANKILVVSVDTVDPKKILPPEFTPDR